MSTKGSFPYCFIAKDVGSVEIDDAFGFHTVVSSPGRGAPGTDDAIGSELGDLLSNTSGPLPGETGDFVQEVSNGAVRITGSTYSAFVYQRLQDAVPKMKAIQGVRSVDISAVRKL